MQTFLDNILLSAQQIAILYILVAVGFVSDKTKIYKEKAARLTNDLLFYIITPAVLIKAFLDIEFTKDTLIGLLISFAAGAGIHVLGILINLPFFRNKENSDNAIFKYASIYGNVGYMGLPLVENIVGQTGVFYCSVVIVAFNLFCFTHGIAVMSKKEKSFHPKKLLINPGTIAIIIGLPLFLLNIHLPVIAAKPLEYVSSLNTPLAMIIFGTYLSNTDLKTLFNQWQTYIVVLLKLIALPLLTLVILRQMHVNSTLLLTMTILAAAPSANNTVMFSAKYDRDTGVASKTVSLVSFISIITLPIMAALAQA